MKDKMKQRIVEWFMGTFLIPIMVFCFAYGAYRIFLLILLAALKAGA